MEKYSVNHCLELFEKCIETSFEGDMFACDLHIELCPDYIRLSKIFDDPMYIGFLNVTKSVRRRFCKACEQFLKEV
jgi:hypothetical protein